MIPACVDACKGRKSPLWGCPVYVVGAGGISDGRGVAMSLSLGAKAVWVGTRFVAAAEAGAPDNHKNAIVNANHQETIKTIIYSGRPMRVIKSDYILDFE